MVRSVTKSGKRSETYYRISSKIGRPSKISRFENRPRYLSRDHKNRPKKSISEKNKPRLIFQEIGYFMQKVEKPVPPASPRFRRPQ